MSNIDALADLGLDLGTSAADTVADNTDALVATEQAAAPEAEAPKRESKPRQEVKIAVQEAGLADFVPELQRLGGGGTRESKYDLAGIAAPVGPSAEGKFQYHTLTIKGEEGQDVEAVVRSVQSAVTAFNKKNKDDKTGVYLVTRSHVENGVKVGAIVYRVDGTLGGDAS
jgi:hypothetical protein